MHFECGSAGKMDTFSAVLVSAVDLLVVDISTAVFFCEKVQSGEADGKILQYFQKIEFYQLFQLIIL